MESLAQRIKLIRKKRKLSQEELAKMVGVSQNAIQKIESGETKEPRNILQLSKALAVDPNWLQFGIENTGISISGSALNNSSINNNINNSINGIDPHRLVQDEPDNEHRHKITYLDVRAAAGVAEYSNVDYPEIISSIWLSDDGMLELVGKRSANGLHIINVPTDSMEPTIPKGSPVVIDMSIQHYNGDGIYAFSVNGNLFIKRLQKLMKGGYKIISDNKEKYEPEDIDDEFLDNAKFIGKFLKVWDIKARDL